MLFVLKKVDWLRISFILIPVTTGHGNWCTCAACSKNIAPHFKEIGRKLAYIGGGWDKEWETETTTRLKSLNVELWMDAEIKQESSIKGPYEPWAYRVDIKHFRNSPYFMSFSIWFLNYHQTRYRSDRSICCSNLMRGKCCRFSCYTIVLKNKGILCSWGTVFLPHLLPPRYIVCTFSMYVDE